MNFTSTSDRRDFLKYTGAAAATLLSANSWADALIKKGDFKVGYSSITWGGKDEQAISELAGLGFKGIQLRANTFGPYRNKVSELKDALIKNNLTLAMFSSGNVETDPAKFESTVDTHVAHASFVKALGGNALQLTNSLRPKDRLPTTEELKKLAEVMNEIGKQTADLGVQAVYHNHMNQLGETPEEVDVIVQAMDPRYIKLLLDIAHYKQGGGEPQDAVIKYKSILHSLHLKDTKPAETKNGYKFVELGQGRVDVPAVFASLNKIKFKGWAVVELDGVPDPEKSPLICAEINKKYITEVLKYPL
ncbi:sugar phosphate isomerase/epimerase [Dyadobacter sp. CY343]|uniref:sugar phosphate isomerase/epimerase family protein n=1 Tax=Dyadobacter sp. CY343 TaxID=2907299 RepID=UPI001F337F2D|nr:sugar phosphate isomerase/epimerase family protein [Dyadobacter sp. CY343]MCE7063266.1 sugar phosphate isomerase/epimerase [Dyadobacter sp. CY343]